CASLSDVHAADLIAPPSTLANIQESYTPNTVASSTSKGSIQLIYSGQGPATIRLSQTFQFPYHGPPENFLATVKYLVTNASLPSPVHVSLFIERQQPIVQDFYLPLHTSRLPNGNQIGIDANETGNSNWLPPPSLVIDGKSSFVQSFLGTSTSGFLPSPIIFSSSGAYSFGIQVTFYC